MTARRLMWIYLAVVVVVTAAAFLPSLFNGFVLWDDPYYVTENLLIKTFSINNLQKIFTRGFQGCYCPLTILSHIPEYLLFDLRPFGYHLTNYLLHIAVTVLVFCFIRLISSSSRIAFISALFFGIHPLHVESVAWISERKDLLCAVFYMSALIAYIFFIKNKRPVYYVICLSCALLSLLAKPMAVTIPLVLLLIDFFYGHGISVKSVIDKVPFFAISAIFAVINLYFQTLSGAMKFSGDMGVKAYFFSKTIPFYLYKLLLPVNLSILYPYHNVKPAHLAELPYYFLTLFLLIIIIGLSFRSSKKTTFGILFFLITISPVLKIIPAGDTFAADRYMYLPSIGILYIFALFCDWAFDSAALKAGKAAGPVMISALSLAAMWFSSLTWQRTLIWKDTETLFAHVIKRYPAEPSPYNNMGVFYQQKGDTDRAMRYFELALAVDPGNQSAVDNIESLNVLMKTRKEAAAPAPAVPDSGGGVEEARTLNALGVEKGKAGDLDRAISLFNQALKAAPDYADTYNNLGFAYYRKGDLDRAEGYFKKAVDLDPAHEKARVNLKAIRRMR